MVRRLHEALLTATTQTAIIASGFRGRYQGNLVDDTDPIGQHRLRAIVAEVWGTETGTWAVPSPPPVDAATPAVGKLVWVTFEGGDTDYPDLGPRRRA